MQDRNENSNTRESNSNSEPSVLDTYGDESAMSSPVQTGVIDDSSTASAALPTAPSQNDQSKIRDVQEADRQLNGESTQTDRKKPAPAASTIPVGALVVSILIFIGLCFVTVMAYLAER